MRIALCPSSYFPNVGGVEEHVRNLAQQLVRRGHAVEVWTPIAGGEPRTEDVDSIPVRRLPIPMPARNAGSLTRFVGAYLPARSDWRRQIDRFQPDVVNVHCFGPNGIYANLAARSASVPLVLSLHGETFMDDGGVFETSTIMKRGLRKALGRAALVTGCSQVTLDDAQGRFGLRPGAGTVVFNGVDLNEDCGQTADVARPAHERRYVLALGRMVRNKGFDLLLDAFADLAARHPDIDLMIGGSGPVLATLRSQAESLGLADRVILPGRLDRDAVRNAMRFATAFAMPSRVEPFGIVVLEGWRARVPVIASSLGGPPEFVTDRVDGLLVNPHDRKALAQAMDLVLGNAEFASRIALAGQRRVVDFDWERIAAKYEMLYGRIAG